MLTFFGIIQAPKTSPQGWPSCYDTKEETKEEDMQIKQVTAEELVHLVWNMSQEEKDKVIQDVFMKDF